jgi:hypothetical protein
LSINPGRTPQKAIRVDPGGKPSSHKIDSGKKPEKKAKPWLFSFRFWGQIRHFGLDTSTPSWFVALLEKFVECSKEDLDKFRSDLDKRAAYRFHEIDWGHKGVPIQRAHLGWVDAEFLNNPIEYPFVQFQISQALGRVVGFFDDKEVFNVVLLDPRHNIQPSKYTSYKVRPCNPLPTDYQVLASEGLKIANTEWCQDSTCSMRPRLLEISRETTQRGLILLNIDAKLYDKIHKLIDENKIETLEHHMEMALMMYEDGEKTAGG